MRGGRVERGFVTVDVEESWVGSLFGFADRDGFACEDLRDLGRRIVHIARNDRVFGADVDAGGFETDVDAVRAVIAFGRRVIVGVHIDGVIWAGLRASFAADAAAVVEIDDAVLASEQRRNRTDLDARRVCAVIATHHAE